MDSLQYAIPNSIPNVPGFPMVSQTKIALVGYILLLIAQLIFIIQGPQSMKQFAPNIIAFVIISVLGLYVINCTVVGSCNAYAWITGYIIAALGIAALFGVTYLVFIKK